MKDKSSLWEKKREGEKQTKRLIDLADIDY